MGPVPHIYLKSIKDKALYLNIPLKVLFNVPIHGQNFIQFNDLQCADETTLSHVVDWSNT